MVAMGRGARGTGAALLRAPRDGLPESRISAGSDFDESPEENEQESDESDDDFELRMATSSEDEDTDITADEDAVELAGQ
jgi:Mg-chelatase subunit ChlI